MTPEQVLAAADAAIILMGKLADYIAFLKAQHGLTDDQIAAMAKKQLADNADERAAILAQLTAGS